ncbi:MAG: ABC transporter ATP-binding protein [Aquificota bacterium]|nr:ABC transporter ATP-binding protein [Aquificota bacterium]
MSLLISLRRVSKSVEGEEILREVSLEVKRGEFVSVIGPSGSGKSTLLYIMGLLDRPTSGEVFFDGEKVDFSDEERLSEIRNRRIGFVFQFHYLIPELTALENVMVPMIKAGMSRKEAEERACDLLRVFGLSGKERRKPYQLSGGEQQRVAIARAVANDPDLILADEPTGNLDTKNTEIVMDLLEDLNSSGTTIVMVTHDAELSIRADRTIEIRDGRLV